MKIAVSMMAALVLLLAGCTSPIAMPTNSVITQVNTTPVGGLVSRSILVSDAPKVYVGKTVGSDGIFPPEIVMSKVNYGDELSTWTGNIPDLGIKSGEPLSLYIFNRTGEEVTYNISCKIPEKVLEDDDENEYMPFAAAILWVEFSDKIITVPPETVAAVSVRLLIPNRTLDFTLPDKWAFQLYVKPIEGGNIQRAYLQNWLISMR